MGIQPDSSKEADQSQHLFIVRIWHETAAQKPAKWRGSVEHVPSRQQIYFNSLSDLNDFITLRGKLHAEIVPEP